MSPTNSVLWSLEPHTSAKHEVLVEYLKAWLPILSMGQKRIIYLDGFAGPGEYKGGEEGSPVLAIRTAKEHTLRERFNEILFWFIEKDSARAKNLEQVLERTTTDLPSNIEYHVEGAEFAPTFESVLDEIEDAGANLAPTFAFLDPFGFSGLPMELITRLLSYDRCEVLVTFMTGFINRFNDELRENALNELFMTSKWEQIREIEQPDQRRDFLINLYENQLRNVAGAKHVRTFAMYSKQNQLLYHLVYATKHWKGLEVMKEAMYKVDKRGTYTFSDATDPDQTFLIDYQNDAPWESQAGEMVYDEFKGETCSPKEIKLFVITQTPFIFRKKILKRFEKQYPDRIEVNNRSRRLTYPDRCEITFID